MGADITVLNSAGVIYQPGNKLQPALLIVFYTFAKIPDLGNFGSFLCRFHKDDFRIFQIDK